MALRTVQTSFPGLVDAKFAVMRSYRNARKIPFDRDFEGIRFFPLTPGALFLDVGANRGQSTDAVLMLTNDTLVQLFEPNLELCRKLHQMFARNPRVVINRFGLADNNSTGILHVPFYKKWMFDGLASFDRGAATEWLQDRVFFYRDKHLAVKELVCELRRLDDLNLAPFFVKIDVQGYEIQVIRGGLATIKAHEPVLMVESPPSRDVIKVLEDCGYSFYTFRDDTFIRDRAESNNTFFMTERRAALVRTHIRS
jgi:FkbM family methyltransferase